MSNAVMTWAFAVPAIPTGAKFVLVALADNASDEGYCYPGQARIASKTNLTDRAVRTHLTYLELHGFIRRAHRYKKDGTRTSDCYWITGYMLANDLPVPEEFSTYRPNKRKETTELPESSSGRLPENFSAKPSVPQPSVEPSGLVTDSHESVRGARNLLFDSIQKNWLGTTKPNRSQASLIAKVAGELLVVNATPAQVDQQWQQIAARYGGEIGITPMALAKHWGTSNKKVTVNATTWRHDEELSPFQLAERERREEQDRRVKERLAARIAAQPHYAD